MHNPQIDEDGTVDEQTMQMILNAPVKHIAMYVATRGHPIVMRINTESHGAVLISVVKETNGGSR